MKIPLSQESIWNRICKTNLKFRFGVVGGRGGGQHGMEGGVTLVGGRTPRMVEVMQLGG